jgi:hypothetical protein
MSILYNLIISSFSIIIVLSSLNVCKASNGTSISELARTESVRSNGSSIPESALDEIFRLSSNDQSTQSIDSEELLNDTAESSDISDRSSLSKEHMGLTELNDTIVLSDQTLEESPFPQRPHIARDQVETLATLLSRFVSELSKIPDLLANGNPGAQSRPRYGMTIVLVDK